MDHRGTSIKVLDTGFVRLVDYMGGDLSVVRAARVSYDADWREHGEKTDHGLLKFMMRNKHTSPFEAVVITFEVRAPLFIFRQWHRHRTWSYNEVSARYTQLDMGYYVPRAEDIGVQSADNKQVRDIEPPGLLSRIAAAKQRAMAMVIDTASEDAFRTYRGLLEDGCPRELARSVLPLSAYSRMFATVDLHNLFHFIGLRIHPHAQYEIRQYAHALLRLTEAVVPVCVGAWRNYHLTDALKED